MSHLTGTERARYVQEMFTRIAPRYDLMNRIMTAGQDILWRKKVIRRARIPGEGYVLDLGAGTGDLAVEAMRRHPGCIPVAADFTVEMMLRGRERPVTAGLSWAGADALQLPFPEDTFEAVISAFLLRNVGSVPDALREKWRVLKPGGWLVALDTTRPHPSRLTPLINLYLNTVIPRLGSWISGQAEAYRYLPASTAGFLTAEQLAFRMGEAGFSQVGFERTMFGTVAIHWGCK